MLLIVLEKTASLVLVLRVLLSRRQYRRSLYTPSHETLFFLRLYSRAASCFVRQPGQSFEKITSCIYIFLEENRSAQNDNLIPLSIANTPFLYVPSRTSVLIGRISDRASYPERTNMVQYKREQLALPTLGTISMHRCTVKI